ncbi:hypothetical protein ACS0TY_013203 [Phlomoides rotata]
MRNDKPRNNDRSRNYAPRRDMQGQNSGANAGGLDGNYGGQQNVSPLPPGNAPNARPRQPNYGGGAPPNNPGNYPANNMRGPGPNNGGAPYQPSPDPNQSGFPSRPVELKVPSISEMSYCAHERKLFLIPLPFLISAAIAGCKKMLLWIHLHISR